MKFTLSWLKDHLDTDTSAREIASVDFAAVTLFDEKSRMHEIRAVSGGGEEDIVGQRFRHNAGLVAMVLEGDQAVTAARQVIGATNPLEAAPGSIRGDFAIAVGQNMVHGSDSPESAEREATLFFPDL